PGADGVSSLAKTTSARGGVGLRIFGPWVSAAVISSEQMEGLAPGVYDTLLLPTPAGRSTAQTLSIRGPMGRGFGIDSWVTRWAAMRPYQPQYQSRSELNYTNSFTKRFPRGDFALHVAGVYEYRGHMLFPLAA